MLGPDGGSVALVLKGLSSLRVGFWKGLTDFCGHLRPHILGLLCSCDLCSPSTVPELRFQRILRLGQLGEHSAAARGALRWPVQVSSVSVLPATEPVPSVSGFP